MSFGKWRNKCRRVNQPNWPSDIFSDIFPKFVDSTRFVFALFNFKIVGFERRFNFFQSTAVRVDSVAFFDSFGVIPLLPLFRKINFKVAKLELKRAESFIQNIFEHFFLKSHSIFPIPVSRVPFHCDMLWQMFVRIILISKTRTEVVDFFKTSTKKSFQRQFVANSKVKLRVVQSIHMRNERIRVSTTSGMFKHRNIDFEKSSRIQKIASRLPKLRTTNKTIANFKIDIHINISSAESLFFVRKTVLLSRHWSKRFRKKFQFASRHRNFASFTLDNFTSRLNKIARVEQIQVFNSNEIALR